MIQLAKKEALIDGLALALEERREALRKTNPELFLAAYDALGRIGRCPAIVPVHGAHCGGCYLRLPPQLDSSIRRRQSLCLCPYCRRLLYASPRVGTSEKANESRRKPEDRTAAEGKASKQVRRIAGKRAARQELRAAKRPHRADDAHRTGNARRKSELAKANPVEQSVSLAKFAPGDM